MIYLYEYIYHKYLGPVRSKDMQTPPLLSFVPRVIAKIHRKLAVFSTKMFITRKIKIGKILNMICVSIQHIPHLSCKF